MYEAQATPAAIVETQVSSAAPATTMQTQPAQTCARHTYSLEELLAAFQAVRTADKPIVRSQSELAMAAVLHASTVVGGRCPQSTLSAVKHAGVRCSSLPIEMPSYTPLQVPQPVLTSEPLPSFPQVNTTLPVLSNMAALQDDRPIKSCLYKVHALDTMCCLSALPLLRSASTLQ